MKKWLTSENAVTFGLMVAATIVAMMIGPWIISKINAAKSKVTG